MQEYTPEQQELYNRTQRIWKDAIDVQDACNLSGVVHAFSRILSDMCAAGLDTRQRNTHPVCIMFSSKIASLTGSEPLDAFSAAYDTCKQQAALTEQVEG